MEGVDLAEMQILANPEIINDHPLPGGHDYFF